ncbi:GDP-mannose 4,6-dehydratase [Variovorax robiniae]|uniref:GDP-mannose 4,6-dehydratase n=1 Tax=Variovorax robiniae TaxID=1836199 RepID=A0ABU8X4K7_9BURK
MRILVTGADGFTGRTFDTRAREAGHELVPLRSNLKDAEGLRREVGEIHPDAVVHLAGIAFVAHANDDAFYAVNVVGTTNLLDALARLPVPPSMILLASSANVYGNCKQSPIAETQAPAPVNHYGMSKLAMEYMARTYMDRLRLVIARPFNYTGPGQDVNFLIPKLAKHFAHQAPTIALGNLHVEREFNDVRTVCDAYLSLLAHGEPGQTYNVCSGRPYNLQHVVDLFERLTGHTINVSVNPEFVRPNEVHRLCGDPSKLVALLEKVGVHLGVPPLEETLRRMLTVAVPRDPVT